jgi:hypothetical protein
VKQQIANLKASGEYAHIIKVVQEEIERENKEALQALAQRLNLINQRDVRCSAIGNISHFPANYLHAHAIGQGDDFVGHGQRSEPGVGDVGLA